MRNSTLAEAQAGGCTESLWFRTAEAREAQHPQDAIAIYEARIDPIVAHTDKRAYDEAAELMERIGGLMKRSGSGKEFGEWVNAVRAKHKAKRNFMKRLERLG